MFKLAERRGDAEGLYCGPEGLFLGPISLIAKLGSVYQLRRRDAAADLLTEAFGLEHDPATLLARLPMICQALQESDLCRATILAVHARIGPLSPTAIEKLAAAETLAKYNFNPDEPRDAHGRWTDNGDAGPPPATPDTGGHPELLSAQELLPLGARPPLLFEEPPETPRPFKEPIPNLSGKEGAKDIPGLGAWDASLCRRERAPLCKASDGRAVRPRKLGRRSAKTVQSTQKIWRPELPQPQIRIAAG